MAACFIEYECLNSFYLFFMNFMIMSRNEEFSNYKGIVIDLNCNFKVGLKGFIEHFLIPN